MLLPEFRQDLNSSLECHHDSVIVIKDGNFSWEVPKANGKDSTLKKPSKNGVTNKDEETNLISGSEASAPSEFLSGINLEIKRGRLVGVCGAGLLIYNHSYL